MNELARSVRIAKGDRVRAEWMEAKPLGSYSLTGMQAKVSTTLRSVVGTVRHVRGDHPTEPTEVKVYVDPDPGEWSGPTTRPPGCSCSQAHAEFALGWIAGTLDERPRSEQRY